MNNSRTTILLLLALCSFSPFAATTLIAADAEPHPFSPAPLQLQTSPSAVRAAIGHGSESVMLPAGPVRIDYGIPIRVWRLSPRSVVSESFHLIDAPGPGYREQKARANSK